MLEVAKRPHLVLSEEFLTFGRTKGELSFAFERTRPDSIEELLDKYKAAFRLDEGWELNSLLDSA